VMLPNQIVDTSGNITVPYAGTIRAAGRTPSEVQQAIMEALMAPVRGPRSTLRLKPRLRSGSISLRCWVVRCLLLSSPPVR
jgi:hypothetical protein